MIIKPNFDDFEETRIDSFLADYLEEYSRSKISKLLKDKKVFVNKKPVKPKYIVKEDDVIEFDLDDLKIKPVESENIPLEVIYEDKDIAIINKPIGMLTHPTTTIRTNTLVNALKYRFDNLSTINGEDRDGIVHRLDYNTSGLLIIALHDISAQRLKEMFKNREIIKKYRAIVKGNIDKDEGIIEKPIARSTKNRKLMEINDDGRYAKTGYSVLDRNKGFTYLDLILYTGRTHQLRVHLSSINRPILGDKDYGGLVSQYSIDHQLLQSYYLEFNHPISNQKLKFTIEESSEINKYKKIIFED